MNPQHDSEWDDLLQDWIDGDLAPAAAERLAAHLIACETCRGQLAALEQLEDELCATVRPLSLDASFDRRLMAQVAADDEARRVRVRRQIDQELQSNLALLSRSWRRTLALLLPGLVGGVALMLTVLGLFDNSELLASSIARIAEESGGASIQSLHVAFFALVGAALGITIARWLATLVD